MTATKITPGLITTLAGATGLPASAGFEFVSAVSASTSATVSFTGLDAGYDHKIIIQTLRPVTDGTLLGMVLGVSGPTYRTSNYLSRVRVGYYASQTASTTNVNLHPAFTLGNAVNELASFDIDIFDPGNASVKTVTFHHGMMFQTTATQHWTGGASLYTTAEAHTAVQFAMNSGNILAGEFKHYRRPNA
jgi:hypothetical protein